MSRKFVLIGAGSHVFTRNLVRDILTFPAFADATIALVDINPEGLEYARRAVQHIIDALLVTKSRHRTLFEEALIEMGIEYHRIQIATPRHNGKVERQHRTDELRFYKRMRMYCLEDGRKQLAAYQRRSNDHIMTCLGMRSPNEVLDLYRGIM